MDSDGVRKVGTAYVYLDRGPKSSFLLPSNCYGLLF